MLRRQDSGDVILHLEVATVEVLTTEQVEIVAGLIDRIPLGQVQAVFQAADQNRRVFLIRVLEDFGRQPFDMPPLRVSFHDVGIGTKIRVRIHLIEDLPDVRCRPRIRRATCRLGAGDNEARRPMQPD